MSVSKDSYQSRSAQLDEILDKLQNGNLDIDQATEAYEQGMILVQELERHLKLVENKVKKIKNNFNNK